MRIQPNFELIFLFEFLQSIRQDFWFKIWCICVQSAPNRSNLLFEAIVEDLNWKPVVVNGRRIWSQILSWFFVAVALSLGSFCTMLAFCIYCLDFRLLLLCSKFGVQSITYLTRLETRTKEFKVYASHWSLKVIGVMKVGHLVSVMWIEFVSINLMQHRPMTRTCSVVESERTLWDPKDGELCPNRTKSEETLMEVRSGSDVQIDRLIWV